MLLKDKGKNTNLSLTSQLTLFTARYYIQGNIRPHFIFAASFPLVVSRQILRLGEFLCLELSFFIHNVV